MPRALRVVVRAGPERAGGDDQEHRGGDRRPGLGDGLDRPRAARAARPASAWRSSAAGRPGLAAAQQLRRAGHAVTVYERDDRPGGLLTYGIPDFKMAKVYVERRIDQLEKEGVRFVLNAEVGVGRTIDPRELRDRHDALLLTVGATLPRDLEIPGRHLKGVEPAMPFLTQQNRRSLRRRRSTASRSWPPGKNVIIIGGGDTAADCLGTCHRQQARSVTAARLQPAPARGREPRDPLAALAQDPPDHPGPRGRGQARLADQDQDASSATIAGHVKELHAVRVQQYFDEAGERQFEEIHGSELIFPCELVLLAIGFSGPERGAARGPRAGPDRAGRDPLQSPVHDQPGGRVRRRRLPPGPVAGRLGHRRGPGGGPAHRPVPDGTAQHPASLETGPSRPVEPIAIKLPRPVSPGARSPRARISCDGEVSCFHHPGPGAAASRRRPAVLRIAGQPHEQGR